MLALAISLILAYLLGSIPTGFILARVLGKIDIRNAGSGNVGATNVYRTVGKLPGVITLLIDIAKGAIAAGFLTAYFYKWNIPLEPEPYRILAAASVISGHNWTPFLNFKGGKGIATSAGALAVICPKILGLVVLVWVIIFALTRIVSIASIVASVFFLILAAFKGNFAFTLFAIILCLISIFKHRSNIMRLVRGEEKKLTL